MKNLKEAVALADQIRQQLQEKGNHNPFQNFKKLGNKSPGKRKGADEKGDWECKRKGKYVQVCKGVGAETEGRKKIVRIDASYKKDYNADYKAGVSDGTYKPGARSGAGKKKKKLTKKKK